MWRQLFCVLVMRAVWMHLCVGGSGFVFLIILVVAFVLDRCSAVWRFGAGGLVVVLVVVLVNCFYIRNTFHSEFTW